MEGFTIIDGVVALVIVISALLAYARGFVREALAIVGWIAAAVVAFLFAPMLEPLVKEVPVVGEFIADSCELSMIGAFAAVFALALIVASFITPLFSTLVQRSALGGIDQGFGFIFGVARGVLLVAVAYFVYETVITARDIPVVDESRSARVFAGMTEKVQQGDPEAALGWITDQYEALISQCDATAANARDAETPAVTAPEADAPAE